MECSSTESSELLGYRRRMCRAAAPTTASDRRSVAAGFTLLEVVLAVAALAVVATIGVMAMSNSHQASQATKLQSDVVTLNDAVQMYLFSGGDLSTATTPAEVLAKLKTVVPSAQAERQINPLTGSMIDRRLVPEMQTAAEAASGEPRVYWNSSRLQFELKTSGTLGVKRFVLDPSLATERVQTEVRDGGSMEFAGSSGWVWDHNNQWNTDSQWTPTGVSTTPFPTAPTPPTDGGDGSDGSGGSDGGSDGGGSGGDGGDGDDDDTPPIPRLPTPNVSPGGGAYPTSSYPKSVGVTNAADYPPNGTLRYRLNYGAWQNYSGPVSVVVNTTFEAKAFTADATVYQDSNSRVGYYSAAIPPRLPTPVLNPSGGAYLATDYPLSVTVANASTYGSNGVLKFQINAGPWQSYVGSITVNPDQTVNVQAFTTDSDNYRDSDANGQHYYAVASSFAGSTTGKFREVGGGPNLDYTLTEDDSFLSHGTTTIELDGETIDAGEANTLKFLSSNFSGMLPGQEFKVGEILYHNGTTFDSSHASRTKLQVTLNFTSPSTTKTISIQLDLVNTENTSDPDASADYVKFNNVNTAYNIEVGGVTYRLNLQFGTTDVNGYASASQFHVYEGATARGELRGTMTVSP